MRRSSRGFPLTILLLCALGANRASASDPSPAKPVAVVSTSGWTRVTPPGSRTGAGFLTITSQGDDRLLSAESPRAGRVEIHGMSNAGGVMKMWQVKDGLALPRGQAVNLAPGGTHLMFFEVEKPFLLGEKIPLTLRFAKAAALRVELEVLPLGAKGPSSQPAEAKP